MILLLNGFAYQWLMQKLNKPRSYLSRSKIVLIFEVESVKITSSSHSELFIDIFGQNIPVKNLFSRLG